VAALLRKGTVMEVGMMMLMCDVEHRVGILDDTGHWGGIVLARNVSHVEGGRARLSAAARKRRWRKWIIVILAQVYRSLTPGMLHQRLPVRAVNDAWRTKATAPSSYGDRTSHG